MRARLAAVAAVAAGALVVALAAVATFVEAAPPPVEVYAELEGRWQGTFVGYDARGEELYRIAVEQTYRTIDAQTQSVTIEDRMSDGTVVRGTGVNLARRDPDGNLILSCDVRKSNGDRVRHEGRLIRGPRGEKQFIWHSAGDDRIETFRERVVVSGGSTTYEIDGMGRYGDQLMLMAGRYRRVGP